MRKAIVVGSLLAYTNWSLPSMGKKGFLASNRQCFGRHGIQLAVVQCVLLADGLS